MDYSTINEVFKIMHMALYNWNSLFWNNGTLMMRKFNWFYIALQHESVNCEIFFIITKKVFDFVCFFLTNLKLKEFYIIGSTKECAQKKIAILLGL